MESEKKEIFIISSYYKHGETIVRFFDTNKELFQFLKIEIEKTINYFNDAKDSKKTDTENDYDYSMMIMYGKEEFAEYNVNDFQKFSEKDLEWLVGAYLEIGDFIIKNQLGFGAKYVYFDCKLHSN